VRITTRIAHARSAVVPREAEKADVRDYAKDAAKYVMMPAMARARHAAVEEHMCDLSEYAETLPVNEEIPGDGIGVVTSGIAYRYVREALPQASVFKLGMVHPLPVERIRAFAQKVDKLIVAEELEPFIENALKAAGIAAEGKSLFPVCGELSVNLVAEKLDGASPEHAKAPALPTRPPVMCPGCPHRATYYLLNRLRLTATGDIGCYTLGALPPLQGIDTCLCMGASVGMAFGAEKVSGKGKTVAALGDSTFIHGGITGLIDIVYNKGATLVLILDNCTTAMTGRQDHPATGRTLQGEPTSALDFEKLARAIGVRDAHTIDPTHFDVLEQTIKDCLERDEPSVIVAKRPCVLIPGQQKLPAYKINDENCNQCGACIRLGCPAIIQLGQNKEKKFVIDSFFCQGCGLCEYVCKFEAIEVKQ